LALDFQELGTECDFCPTKASLMIARKDQNNMVRAAVAAAGRKRSAQKHFIALTDQKAFRPIEPG